jgi:hypothetical protein
LRISAPAGSKGSENRHFDKLDAEAAQAGDCQQRAPQHACDADNDGALLSSLEQPAVMKRIYGKHKSQRVFKAMDLQSGGQARNLIYASLLTEDQAKRFMKREAPRNPEWQFEIRDAG